MVLDIDFKKRPVLEFLRELAFERLSRVRRSNHSLTLGKNVKLTGDHILVGFSLAKFFSSGFKTESKCRQYPRELTRPLEPMSMVNRVPQLNISNHFNRVKLSFGNTNLSFGTYLLVLQNLSFGTFQ